VTQITYIMPDCGTDMIQSASAVHFTSLGLAIHAYLSGVT